VSVREADISHKSLQYQFNLIIPRFLDQGLSGNRVPPVAILASIGILACGRRLPAESPSDYILREIADEGGDIVCKVDCPLNHFLRGDAYASIRYLELGSSDYEHSTRS
jgi:hypothetical protein